MKSLRFIFALLALVTSAFGQSKSVTANPSTGSLLWPDATTFKSINSIQPLDSDLTTIAGQSNTSFGLEILTKADAAAILTYIGAQPLDADLTSLAAASSTATWYYRRASGTWQPIVLGSSFTLDNVTGAFDIGLIPWSSILKTGSSLADLATRSASDLSSGTLPDARFPATLPAASGVNLTALNASNLGSGTVPDARFPSTLPALNGSALTNLNATNLSTGTVPNGRLDGDLTALANNSGTGLWSVASSTTGNARTITAGTGISVSNGSGVSGNPTITMATPAVQTVTSHTNKLALTGLATGQEVINTHGGYGFSRWRYLGGGESTATNWALISHVLLMKSAYTGRNTTTTFADDPHLVADWLPIGNYQLEIQWASISVSTGGFKWQLGFGGAGNINNYARAVYPGNSNDYLNGLPKSYASPSPMVAGAAYVFQVDGRLKVTTAGSVSFQWAQNSSNGSDTEVEDGAYMLITPMNQ